MAKRSTIENTRQTVEGLAKMCRELGYKSRFGQLVLNNGCTVSDILEFLEDNPGAIEAIVTWVLDNDCDREGNSLEDDDDDENEDDDESDTGENPPSAG